MYKISRREALAGAAAGFGSPRSPAHRRIRRSPSGSSARAGGGASTSACSRKTGARESWRSAISSSEAIDKTKTAVPGTDQARVYKDYRELLADPSIDAVLIATPVFLHPEHFEAAVKARKHIYIEKPAGADVAGVKRLLAAAQQADKSKHIVFGFQNRYSPEYHAAEEILRTGKLGQLLMMECHFIKGGVTDRKIEHPPEERITPLGLVARSCRATSSWNRTATAWTS